MIGFEIGDQVKISPEGMKALCRPAKFNKERLQAVRGTVIGFGRSGLTIRISRNDTPKHYKESYWHGFLERIPVHPRSTPL